MYEEWHFYCSRTSFQAEVHGSTGKQRKAGWIMNAATMGLRPTGTALGERYVQDRHEVGVVSRASVLAERWVTRSVLNLSLFQNLHRGLEVIFNSLL